MIDDNNVETTTSANKFLNIVCTNELKLDVLLKKTIKSTCDLSTEENAQLTFIISSPQCYFGNKHDVKAAKDCFVETNVDNAIVHYTQITCNCSVNSDSDHIINS